MKYSNSISHKIVSKFAYLFLLMFGFIGVACESDNDDNPLAKSLMTGYIADTNYWFSNTPSVLVSKKDTAGKYTKLDIQATSQIDQSTIEIFVPYPEVGSFSVEQADSTDSVFIPRTTIRYNGEDVPDGSINIIRLDTFYYVLEAEINFSFTGVVEGDSGTIDTTDVAFQGEIKAAYLKRD